MQYKIFASGCVLEVDGIALTLSASGSDPQDRFGVTISGADDYDIIRALRHALTDICDEAKRPDIVA